MPRPKKPLAVVQANGKHMTKEEIRRRRDTEQALGTAPTGRPEPPAWLEPFLVPAFHNLAELLEARQLVTDADGDAMAAFVRARYLEQAYCSKVIELMGEGASIAEIKQWQTLQDTASKQCRAYRTSFGLTPKDRFNLVPATTALVEETSPADKFAAFVE